MNQGSFQPENSKKSGDDALSEREKRRRVRFQGMHAIDPQEAPSWGEYLLPFLFAAMETCWIDAIFIGLAGFNLFQSRDPFMPLWSPFVLIAGTYFFLGQLQRHPTVASASSTDEGGEDAQTEQTRPATPCSPLFIASLTLIALFVIWSSIYAQTAFFFDPRWLLTLLNDVFFFNLHAFHLFGIVALSLYFCWRGVRFVDRDYEPSQALNVLRLGLGVIFAVILVRAGQAREDVSLSSELLLLLLIPTFSFLTLAAHALARVTFVRHTHIGGLQGSVEAQERAILMVIGVVGVLLLLLAWFVDSMVSASVLAGTQQVFASLGLLYNWLVQIFATVLIFLLTPVFWLGSWLLSLFPPKQPRTSKAPVKGKPPKPLPHTADPSSLLVPYLRVIIPLLLIVAAMLILRWALHRRRRIRATTRARIAELHESLWSWTLFWMQFKSLLWLLFGRFFPAQKTQETLQLPEEITGEPTARSIREIYRALLARAAQHGYPRKKDETPNEFRQRLDEKLPLVEPQLATVTESYTSIRYGELVPAEAEVARIQGEWSTLQQKWRVP